MRFLSPTPLVRYLYPGSIIWQVKTQKKEIYLTFDDGPNPGVTNHILDLLRTFNARATFFMLGEKVEANPSLFKRIIDEGHTVGNHSYNHVNAWKIRSRDFIANVEKCRQVFDSRLFRPPYGRLPFPLPQALSENYKIIMWSILSYDFDENILPEKIIKVFKYKTRPGSIWVFHDTPKARKLCLNVIPILLDYFIKGGYQFRGLAESEI